MRLRLAPTALTALALLLAGCGGQREAMPWQNRTADAPSAIDGSIFPEDLKLAGNDDVARVLDGRVEHRLGGGLAVLAIGAWGGIDAGSGEAVVERVRSGMAGNRFVGEVVPVPRMLMPQRVTASAIREMGARLQCENVLVWSAWQDGRYDSHLFSPDELHVRLTVEAVIVNVRTGLIPLARTIDAQRVISEVKADRDRWDLIRRGQRECLLDGIGQVCERLQRVLAAAPAHSGG
jgi:hypothetical protein